MPLIRRVPKRGFTNPFRVRTQVVNLAALDTIPSEEVTPGILVEHGLVSRGDRPIKILAMGEAKRAYVIKGCATSQRAREKIEQAGGHVEA
jgi:large subunit ribosomal protein L15